MKALPCLSFLILMILGYHSLSAQERDYQPVRTPPRQSPAPPAEKSPATEKSASKEGNGKWSWEHFRIGGNFGLGFGPITFVDVSPSFGYFVIPEKWQVGIGSKLMYFRSNQPYNVIDPFGNVSTIPAYSTFTYGGGVFTNYQFWQGLMGHVEFEMINKDSFFDITRRVNVPHLLIGGGYMQPIGRSGNFFIAALFNVLDQDESIYAGSFGNFPLIIRTGFGFGFPGRNSR
jgi:hypothetical protein